MLNKLVLGVKRFTGSLRFAASLGVYRISSLFRGRTRTRLVKWAYGLDQRNVLALRDWVLRDPAARGTAIPRLSEWVGSILLNLPGRAPTDAMPALLRSAESIPVNTADRTFASETEEARGWPTHGSQSTHEQDVPAIQQTRAIDGGGAEDPRRDAVCSPAAAEAVLCSHLQALSSQRFEPGPRDVYLVSYPRSGNTWLRAVVAEVMFGESGNSLLDLNNYVPDIYELPAVEDLRPADWHVVKTHETYQYSNRNKFERVIYILRDPRDVVLSYYRYQKTLKHYDASFDHFLADWLAGRIWPGSWREHVMSWAGPWHETPPTTIHILRYEDLLSDVEKNIGAIGQLLGYPLDPSQLDAVIRRTTPDEMRRKESASMRRREYPEGSHHFVGQAKANVWREVLTDRQQSLVADHLGDVMQRFGYER